ncbi:MAG: FKBP-type peptidyl-prolyl cis-trans isomerase [Promethearchaeia archaeon]
MGVKHGDVVKVEYVLSDDKGILIDSSEISNGGPIKVQVGAGQVFRGFENAIIGMEIGQIKEIILQPEEAFGKFDPLLVEKIPKEQFPPDKVIKIGKIIEVIGLNGMTSPGWIIYVEDDYVMVDMNPPLAGKLLNLNLKLIETGLTPDTIANPFQIGMSCNGSCEHDHNHSA